MSSMGTAGCMQRIDRIGPETWCGRVPLLKLSPTFTRFVEVAEVVPLPCKECRDALGRHIKGLLVEARQLGLLD